jgi:cell division protein FtsB
MPKQRDKRSLELFLFGFFMTTAVFSSRFVTIVRWVVVISLWLIIISIAVGKSGISNYLELLQTKHILEESNIQWIIKNQILEDKVTKLKNSTWEQKRYVKEHYGYTETNEYVYLFRPNPELFIYPPSADREDKPPTVLSQAEIKAPI